MRQLMIYHFFSCLIVTSFYEKTRVNSYPYRFYAADSTSIFSVNYGSKRGEMTDIRLKNGRNVTNKYLIRLYVPIPIKSKFIHAPFYPFLGFLDEFSPSGYCGQRCILPIAKHT